MTRRIVLGSMFAVVLLTVGALWMSVPLGGSIDGPNGVEWAASPVILPGGQQMAASPVILPGGVYLT